MYSANTALNKKSTATLKIYNSRTDSWSELKLTLSKLSHKKQLQDWWSNTITPFFLALLINNNV